MSETVPCPCNSGQSYAACCEPLINNRTRATSPEAIMRARYSAFVHVQMDYLRETLHPSQRNDYDEVGATRWASESEWTGLEIVSLSGDPATDKSGTVEFKASYRRKGEKLVHHEIAEFRKTNDIWYFYDGKMVTPGQITRDVPKVGRNETCPCGSGRKFKKCCGAG